MRDQTDDIASPQTGFLGRMFLKEHSSITGEKGLTGDTPHDTGRHLQLLFQLLDLLVAPLHLDLVRLDGVMPLPQRVGHVLQRVPLRGDLVVAILDLVLLVEYVRLQHDT